MLRRLLALSLLLCALGSSAAKVTRTPEQYRRPPDQTFLTFPEWFLVFSPAEYADYLRDRSPEGFPYLGHVRQFWSSYASVRGAIAARGYPFNFGYHVMIVVIGTSTTVEYAMKRAYGTLFGRLAALTRSHGMTDEEKLGAAVAADYVDFIRVRPWYEYDFAARLRQLWTGTSLWGPDAIRKWERKYALTTEYGTKAIYAWIIKLGTHAAYGVASDDTAVVLQDLPAAADPALPGLKVQERFSDGAVLALLPRYQAFMGYAQRLSADGVQFQEIAGNRGDLLLSAQVPDDWTPAACGCQLLFSQPLITEPGRKRVALVIPVPELSSLLRRFDGRSAVLEHVFDY